METRYEPPVCLLHLNAEFSVWLVPSHLPPALSWPDVHRQGNLPLSGRAERARSLASVLISPLRCALMGTTASHAPHHPQPLFFSSLSHQILRPVHKHNDSGKHVGFFVCLFFCCFGINAHTLFLTIPSFQNTLTPPSFFIRTLCPRSPTQHRIFAFLTPPPPHQSIHPPTHIHQRACLKPTLRNMPAYFFCFVFINFVHFHFFCFSSSRSRTAYVHTDVV